MCCGWLCTYEPLPSYWDFTFLVGDLIFAGIFAAEVCIRCCISGWHFWRTWISYLDLVVGISCVIEIYIMLTATETFDLALLRSLRVVKLVKSVRMFNITRALAPLHLLTKCLEALRGHALLELPVAELRTVCCGHRGG